MQPAIMEDICTSLLYSSFLHGFVQNDGMKLLMELLREIQSTHATYLTTKKGKSEELKQCLTDEYDCLLCIKFACRLKDALQHFMQVKGALDCIGQCLIGDTFKSRVITLQILNDICDLPGGFHSVMTLMSSIRLTYRENFRFKTLMGALNSSEEEQVLFMAVCVGFLNKLVGCSESVNATVYLQYELKLAGFEPESLDKYSYGESPESHELSRQLGVWHAGYIDVQGYRSVLASSENRSQMLRQEVDRLQGQLKKTEKKIHNLERELHAEHEKCDQYRERAAELQDTVTKLNEAYRLNAGEAAHDIDQLLHLEEALKPLDDPEVQPRPRETRSSSLVSTVTELGGDYATPGAPPPVPPPLPSHLSQTVRQKVMTHANMPSLNWAPLKDITGSLFQDIDSDRYVREIDFSAFEETFKLSAPSSMDGKTAKALSFQPQLDPSLISFIETNRAKNMSITKRHTGLSDEKLEIAINNCQVDVLAGERAELLIKFIPTREELLALSRHKGEEDRLGDPERFISMLSRIERLETKLQLLGYMGKFDELVGSVQPQIKCVLEASNSVLNSERLRRVFEILLAFGNYMNSSKRGYVLGFHLESLYKLVDVKSSGRDQTLLHYIAELFTQHFPDLLDFPSDLDIQVSKGVSYQALMSDVLELRRGIDLMKFECEKQPENKTLEEFFQKAAVKVVDVADMFRRMEDTYRNVCQLFGENFRHTEPDYLFKILTDFVKNFQIAVEDNISRAHGHAMQGYINDSLPSSPAPGLRSPKAPGEFQFHVQTTPRPHRSSTEQSPFDNLPQLTSPINWTIQNPSDSISDHGICIDTDKEEDSDIHVPPMHRNRFQSVLKELADSRSLGPVEDESDEEEDDDASIMTDTTDAGHDAINSALDTLDQVVFEAECGDDSYISTETETTCL